MGRQAILAQPAPPDLWRYTVVFDHLRAGALGTAESVDLITRLAADLA